MIFLGPFIIAALVFLSLPVLVVLAPAGYLLEVMVAAGWDSGASWGLAFLMLIYSVIVALTVQTPFYLVLLLAVVPFCIGFVMRRSSPAGW